MMHSQAQEEEVGSLRFATVNGLKDYLDASQIANRAHVVIARSPNLMENSINLKSYGRLTGMDFNRPSKGERRAVCIFVRSTANWIVKEKFMHNSHLCALNIESTKTGAMVHLVAFLAPGNGKKYKKHTRMQFTMLLEHLVKVKLHFPRAFIVLVSFAMSPAKGQPSYCAPMLNLLRRSLDLRCVYNEAEGKDRETMAMGIFTMLDPRPQIHQRLDWSNSVHYFECTVRGVKIAPVYLNNRAKQFIFETLRDLLTKLFLNQTITDAHVPLLRDALHVPRSIEEMQRCLEALHPDTLRNRFTVGSKGGGTGHWRPPSPSTNVDHARMSREEEERACSAETLPAAAPRLPVASNCVIPTAAENSYSSTQPRLDDIKKRLANISSRQDISGESSCDAGKLEDIYEGLLTVGQRLVQWSNKFAEKNSDIPPRQPVSKVLPEKREDAHGFPSGFEKAADQKFCAESAVTPNNRLSEPRPDAEVSSGKTGVDHDSRSVSREARRKSRDRRRSSRSFSNCPLPPVLPIVPSDLIPLSPLPPPLPPLPLGEKPSSEENAKKATKRKHEDEERTEAEVPKSSRSETEKPSLTSTQNIESNPILTPVTPPDAAPLTTTRSGRRVSFPRHLQDYILQKKKKKL